MKAINLFCFPFAGGNRYSYREYEQHAPPHLKIIPMEYPGRGARVKEPFILDMDVLVDKLYHEMRSSIGDDDYALYGHSMGGLVAFFLSKKLIANHYKPPLHIFVTGTSGPGSFAGHSKKYLLEKKAFIEEIKKLEGCPEEILQHDELLDYFEPILRADFQVSETFSYTQEQPIEVPMTVITGTEEDMDIEDISLWQQETTHPVEFRKLPGKHFFIFKYPQEIMEVISKKILSTFKIYQ
jgi:surfactin synthase thioesterase subunit